ncbi:hypothetical protein [Alteromonas sp. ASW11-130]|uniref:hypothetical protein n=1 Tax=Alteromonas sp. ASW11-130 TaxID=3015775 RepID=UPI002242AA03|nr:hypothetical protein [Alteromonas sp. ASW11-130]MCW8093155.1 hypothetical protein [Alteromonas sp. ASW11-130]
MRYFIALLCITLAGCGGTPKRDDYTKHVNRIDHEQFSQKKFHFSFGENKMVELRGIADKDDTASNSSILYQGGAGFVGMFAQIGVHALMVDSARDDKLAEAQSAANFLVSPLIARTENVTLSSLLTRFNESDSTAEKGSKAVMLKPIFFSNAAMNQLSLKLIAVVPDEKSEKSRKAKPLYQNLIQVYDRVLTDDEKTQLLSAETDELNQVLSGMLESAIYVIQQDLSGRYAKPKASAKTFLVPRSGKSKVVRGKVVEEACGYKVVRDLRSWYVLFKTPPEESKTKQNYSLFCQVASEPA